MRYISTYLFTILLFMLLGCKEEDAVIPEDKDEEESPAPGRNIVPNDFLSDNYFKSLVVEIQYVKGYPPTAASVNNLKEFLQERLHKPEGIKIIQQELAVPGKAAYSLEDIRAIEGAERTQHTSDQTLTAYFFFADGDYASNKGSSKVLGIAYGSSSMVIFEKTIRDYSGGIGEPSGATLETTVINHELAHTLGLVNNGTPMVEEHQDETHGRHCDNEGCLMYYAAETTDIIGNIVGGNIPQLDAACLADLRANGGK